MRRQIVSRKDNNSIYQRDSLALIFSSFFVAEISIPVILNFIFF